MSARARILDAAAEIMRTCGVTSTTTKEIARAAGCSEALLYKHFRDKEELLIHVLKERMPAFAGIRRPGEATVEENLVAIAHGALRFYTRTFPMMASMAAQPNLMVATRDSMKKYETGPHHAVEWLAGYLAGEQRIGRVSPGADSQVMAALLMGACFQQGFLHYVREGVDGGDIPESLAVTLVHGLLPVLLPGA
ncbi:TetR/AcrR family transcriptional regulator [Actinomadura fulvescens]|uniref:TetR/AcrR family transcriptional regulator n=1 Tax=Actinomadura fulvescens TaxID=46160 RepID=A0ABN3PCQ6_9ACTN